MEKAELDYKAHKTRFMYKQINHLAIGKKKKIGFKKMIILSEKIAKIWSKHFDELLNCDKSNKFFSFDLET